VAVVGARVYVLGGWSGRGATDTVFRADVAADGLGPWTAAGPLLRPLEHLGVAHTDGSLCVIGGDDGVVARSEVSCASIAADGSLAAFVDAEPLPMRRSSHETVQIGIDVYVMGGASDFGGPNLTSVLHARIGSAGQPEGWAEVAPLPSTPSFPAAAAGDGRIVLLGGNAGSAAPPILATDVAADGSLSGWREAGALPHITWGAAATIARGRIYLVAGLGPGAPTATVQSADLDDLGVWIDHDPLPDTRFGHSLSVIAPDRLIAIGGWRQRSQPVQSTAFVSELCAAAP